MLSLELELILVKLLLLLLVLLPLLARRRCVPCFREEGSCCWDDDVCESTTMKGVLLLFTAAAPGEARVSLSAKVFILTASSLLVVAVALDKYLSSS